MDTFATLAQSLEAPLRSAVAVTPSDATDLAILPRALYVGTGGNISVVMADGQTVAFSAVPGGTLLPVRVLRVRLTGTSAAAIIALW